MIAPNTNGTAAPVEPTDADAIGTPTPSMKKARRPAESSVGSPEQSVAQKTASDDGQSPQRQRDVEQMVRRVLSMLLSEIDTDRPLINGKLAVDEREAAALLGLNPWQLRDLRTSGKIGHHRIVGGRVRFTYADLREYLDRNHHRATG
jgi:excisionase family DNA binding protein